MTGDPMVCNPSLLLCIADSSHVAVDTGTCRTYPDDITDHLGHLPGTPSTDRLRHTWPSCTSNLPCNFHLPYDSRLSAHYRSHLPTIPGPLPRSPFTVRPQHVRPSYH
jgi:hypothetical protein